MTIRRLALAAAAMAAAWMFALSLPVYADSHEESEKTEEAAEKEHEEKQDKAEKKEDKAEKKESKVEKKESKADSSEAKRDRGPSPEAMRDRARSPEAMLGQMRSLLRDLYGRGDDDEEMRRRGAMAEGIRERIESLRRIPVEQLRNRLIEQTRHAVREKIEKSPEEAHEIEMGGEKRIQEIEKMSEEKLRAVFMEQMGERLRKSMGEADHPNRMGAMMSMRRNRMGETDQPNRMGAMMSMRRNRMGETARWNMRRRVNINRMNRQTDDGDMRFEAFRLEHIPAQHAAEMVDPFMPRNTRIAADPRTNKLFVRASGHGMRIAMEVLREVDIPVDGEREEAEESRRQRQREADEAEENRRRRSEEEMERDEGRRSGAMPMPMYDYESRRQTGQRDPRAGAWPLGGDIFNPYMPANRIEGVLTEKGDDYIAVHIEGANKEIRARLPVVRVGDVWTVKGNLANKIKELDPGDAVIFEWWEAEGVLYLQDIARLEEKRRERIETYLFE